MMDSFHSILFDNVSNIICKTRTELGIQNFRNFPLTN